MPFCGNCGGQVREEAKFCGNCGNPLTRNFTQNPNAGKNEGFGVGQFPMGRTVNTAQTFWERKRKLIIICGITVFVVVSLIIGMSRGTSSTTGVSSGIEVNNEEKINSEEEISRDKEVSDGKEMSSGTTSPAQTENDFSLILNDDSTGIVITKYNGNATTLKIPATIQGMPVREIGEDAFFNNSKITSVVVPEGVTIIRNGRQNFGPFAGCVKLASITFPSSLKIIGKRAFAACTSLHTVIIPEGVTEIGNDAFAGCRSLASVTLPNTLTSLGRSAFSVEFEILGIYEGIESMPVFKSIKLPERLKIIEQSTFSGVRTLTSIVIPEGVTQIEEYAFNECVSLTSVTLPSTITYIGDNAFRGCTALTTIKIPDSGDDIRFGSGAFRECGKINLASQMALKKRGYDGSF